MQALPNDIGLELWKKLRQGDRNAFSKLFMGHVDAMFRYGILFTDDHEFVKDAIQNVFLKLWERHKVLPEAHHISGYLHTSLRNHLLNSSRKSIVSDTFGLPASDHSSEAIADIHMAAVQDDEVLVWMHQQVHALPARMQMALHFYYLEGWNYDQIAELMQIKRQVAINMVYRATQKLREAARSASKTLYMLLPLFPFDNL